MSGVGPLALETVADAMSDLGQLAGVPIAAWARESGLPERVLCKLPFERHADELGDELLARAERLGMRVAFKGDWAYPTKLARVRDAPPLLFHVGPGNAVAPRRRVALVGMRHPDDAFVYWAQKMVHELAFHGVGVVSGVAKGIDKMAHLCAAEMNGETWGFLGSSIDQIDPEQLDTWRRIESAGATLFSEMPPGVRADRNSFPRRNRLISGSSDGVVVMRAGWPTGCDHTVKYAVQQQRPVLGMPGDGMNPKTKYSNFVAQHYGVCNGSAEVFAMLNMTPKASHRPPPPTEPAVAVAKMSADAQAVAALLPEVTSKCFDELEAETHFTSARLLAALFELTQGRIAVEHGGRRFQRV